MAGITEQKDLRLIIAVTEPGALNWAGLLRRGVGVILDRAVSVRDFMTATLGMGEHYATNCVPGLFLNNAPVDDWGVEMVGGGDEVGMSGTMPGLCGIALRRSSPIKVFRPDLVDRQASDKHGGVATVKMFNFVAKDCFRPVLEQGVIVAAGDVLAYLNDQNLDLAGSQCFWNGEIIPGEQVRMVLDGVNGDVLLMVQVGEQ